MLIESNPMLAARSFDREREVRKHIGDFTLFFTGFFPEYVASLPRRGLRLDAFIDYLQAGKESYRIVSFFDQFEYRAEAPLYRRLSDQFETCVYGLNLVKRDLESLLPTGLLPELEGENPVRPGSGAGRDGRILNTNERHV